MGIYGRISQALGALDIVLGATKKPSIRISFRCAVLAVAYQNRAAHSSYLDTVVAIQRARLGASACWRKQIEDF